MIRPFAALRGLLAAHDYSESELAEKLGRSLNYVSLRLNAKASWSQDEQYTIMDLFNVPYDRLHIMFPKGGKRA